METVIPVADGSIGGELAVPGAAAGAPPWPGVVIVHDVFGMGDDQRRHTARFAEAGFLALSPDLYARGGRARCVKRVFSEMLAARGRAFDDIDAARRMLADRTDCTGRIGVAGFCMGGGFALVAAPSFDASAPYYGQLPKDPAVLDGACPVVASFGRRDPLLRGAAAKLSGALERRGIEHDVKEYPDAGHSFANRLPLGPLAPVARVAGIGFHAPSDDDAWQRVQRFFTAHLSSDPE